MHRQGRAELNAAIIETYNEEKLSLNYDYNSGQLELRGISRPVFTPQPGFTK
jgi:hypothetical protein